MMSPIEEWALYQYLTGDKHGKDFLLVEGEETCHDTHISDPGALVALLDKPYYFKDALAEVEEVISDEAEISVYPNPVQGEVTLSWFVPDEVHVMIKIYNTSGIEIETLVNEPQQAGNHQFQFNADQYPSGIYFMTVNMGGRMTTQKLIKIND
jgi:hypothetical protein